ncbi:asparagine synthetase B family protein [Vibrio parahaemolyticus]|uniref:asparagine synthetase B family protein n=1 Tax=Vibrio parahaemolyticus TaxID=670 RepID=UPI00111F5871|nr:asparagine synthase-related protein [Vibrio parahaemolyticus]ELS9252761.1 asparagine synthase [Vibrio parahaemolyticus]TPA63286.1 asparagine synthase [Vibrio parahaemolyticus]HCE1297968.1 asparagine synthase [Vibrio parahaemolyticus]HCE1589695.1 asparagine synthase [Vibrio parahaemolyticus]HCE2226493.1 asparagine synthase [Vibrio parahaemolyticus]
MCGFFITNNPTIGSQHLNIVEETLRFRGPDCSSGLIKHCNWLAYHSRLSIIDIHSGTNQPVKDQAGGLLVFNGEILNYKELGFKYFQEEFFSDTLLLSALLSKGKLNLKELDGFFAFVYINNEGQLTHASRDRFGVKPIFFHRKDGYISLSSEPNTLRRLFEVSVNNEAIEEYKALRAPVFSGSFFNEISTINPGSCLVNGDYFDCSDYLNGRYEDISNDELKEALSLGLKTRVVSDAPIGLLLSRGIDSNMLKELGSFDSYYSIGFQGDEDIEFLQSENISNLKVLECKPEEYVNDFNYLLKLRGEPMSVPNEVLLYKISRLAAEDGIKVLLSGEGADEFFGGYDRIFMWASKAEKFDMDIFVNMYCYIPPEKGSLIFNKFERLFSEVSFSSAFEYVRWFFIRYHMPVLFRRLDFALMAAGVEGREPIANYHVFKLAAKLSPRKLMGDILGKVPLREIISEYKGNSFAFEKKVGFPVDLTKVFENPENLSSYDLWFKENLKVLLK